MRHYGVKLCGLVCWMWPLLFHKQLKNLQKSNAGVDLGSNHELRRCNSPLTSCSNRPGGRPEAGPRPLPFRTQRGHFWRIFASQNPKLLI